MKKLVYTCTLSLFFTFSSAFAGGIRISPISIDIPDNDRASNVTLYNMTGDTSNLQIRVFKWTQSAGNDYLTPTNDIVVSPPFITIGGGQSFNFRVIRTALTPIKGEESYRLIIDELPKPQDTRSIGNGLNVLIRNSLPLFVVNRDAIPNVKAELSASGLQMSNVGLRHALLSDVVITDDTSHKKIKLDINTVNGYLLSNSSKNYNIAPGFYKSGDNYKVNFKVNRLPENITL